MEMDRILADIAAALGFLTRLPLPGRWFAGQQATPASGARAFPLIGALLALPAGAILLLAHALRLPPSADALLSLATLVAITGALHEDGLADVADGFFGGAGPQRRLEIMKDPRVGSFGAIALVLSLGLRIVLLAAVVERAGAGHAFLALIGVEAASRAAMVWVWQALPSARPGGVADRVGAPDMQATGFALAAGAALAVVTYLPIVGLAGIMVSGILAAAATFGLAALARAMIGGQTGDVLGAAQQVAAMSLLIGLVATL